MSKLSTVTVTFNFRALPALSMEIITAKNSLSEAIGALKRQGKTIGFVPTMGALHEGHASLVRRCAQENEITIVSVFVNPTQFNNKEDLDKYPRTLDRDSELLRDLGVSIVFAPSPQEMYSEEEMQERFAFDFGGLDEVMEGKMRPGHFNGVVQVVSKLFRLAQPDRAYFGEKDYQQLQIIRRMVEVMQFDVKIIGCPIVREKSGLALSSRNERLSEKEKMTAVNISRVLTESLDYALSHTVAETERRVAEQINAVEGLEVEYYEIVDQSTLLPAADFSHAIGCVTVYCGPVRLIDNIKYPAR